jgi:large subunit ribosomal protein L21
MYAVVKTGGKQYRVEKEDVVLVEKLNANDGDQVVLDNVLMIGEGKKVTLGNPMINDAAVMAQVVRQTRGPKITMIYKRRRKNSRRKQGHKQDLTLLKIIDIAEKGGSKLAPKKAVTKSTDSKVKTETKAKPAVNKPKVTEPKVETKAKIATTKSPDTKIKAEIKAKTVATKSKEKKVTGQAKTKAEPKIKKSTTKDK